MKHSFKEAYDVLQKHAATLRDQSEPNIDDLLHIVEESVAAYKTCQSRIDAVEKALEKALGQVDAAGSGADGVPAQGTTRPAKVAQAADRKNAEGDPDLDTEIPF